MGKLRTHLGPHSKLPPAFCALVLNGVISTGFCYKEDTLWGMLRLALGSLNRSYIQFLFKLQMGAGRAAGLATWLPRSLPCSLLLTALGAQAAYRPRVVSVPHSGRLSFRASGPSTERRRGQGRLWAQGRGTEKVVQWAPPLPV